MGIFDKRLTFKPFEYDIERFISPINKTYWVHDEVDFTRDVQDYHTKLDAREKYIIGTILKSFAATEMHVADEFWSQLPHYLPKPEFAMLSATYSENEWRHANAYHRLNEVLGLEDFEAFLTDETVMEKFENLTKIKKDHKGKPSKQDVMRTLAVFGAFTENVCLFSQFAILRSFSNNGKNLLKNIDNIIAWSIFDETQHATAAIWLFNKIKEENPELWNDELKSDIYSAAHTTLKLEINLIDQIFANGDLSNLKRDDLVNYMKDRINRSLISLGLKKVYEIDAIKLKELNWFDDKFTAMAHDDFFAVRPTDYTKKLVIFNRDTVFVPKEDIKQKNF